MAECSRTIVQVSAATYGDESTVVIALSSDGIVYTGIVGGRDDTVHDWSRCAPLPQDEVTP